MSTYAPFLRQDFHGLWEKNCLPNSTSSIFLPYDFQTSRAVNYISLISVEMRFVIILTRYLWPIA